MIKKDDTQLSIPELLAELDSADREIRAKEKPGRTQKRFARAHRLLAAQYSDASKTPHWARLAFTEAEGFFQWAKENGQSAPEGAQAHIDKINKSFDKVPKTKHDLKSLLNTVVRDARITFIIEGELLRKRVREMIDPTADHADRELAAWGVRNGYDNDGKRDWVVMNMPIPDEIWNSNAVAGSGFEPWEYEPMQTAVWRQSFTAWARISTAEQRYEAETAILALQEQTQGLT